MATTEELNELASKILSLRAQEAEASQAKKVITDALEQVEGKMLELLEESGLTRYPSPFGTAGISYRTSVKLPKTPEEKAAFYTYLHEIGEYDNLISVNSQKLNSFWKQQMEIAKEQGQDDFNVPGINEVTINPILSFTKAK